MRTGSRASLGPPPRGSRRGHALPRRDRRRRMSCQRSRRRRRAPARAARGARGPRPGMVKDLRRSVPRRSRWPAARRPLVQVIDAAIRSPAPPGAASPTAKILNRWRRSGSPPPGRHGHGALQDGARAVAALLTRIPSGEALRGDLNRVRPHRVGWTAARTAPGSGMAARRHARSAAASPAAPWAARPRKREAAASWGGAGRGGGGRREQLQAGAAAAGDSHVGEDRRLLGMPPLHPPRGRGHVGSRPSSSRR